DRHAECSLPAAPRGAAGDDLGAVLDASLRLEAAFAAGDALDQDTRVFVDQDAQVVTSCAKTKPSVEAARASCRSQVEKWICSWLVARISRAVAKCNE